MSRRHRARRTPTVRSQGRGGSVTWRWFHLILLFGVAACSDASQELRSAAVTGAVHLGRPFPVEPLDLVPTRCRILVVGEASCGGCRRLASNLRSSRVYDDPAGSPFWLFSGSEPEVKRFARRNGIPLTHVALLHSVGTTPFETLELTTTPTLVGVGPQFEVKGLLIDNAIPTGDRYDLLCGGSPGSDGVS